MSCVCPQALLAGSLEFGDTSHVLPGFENIAKKSYKDVLGVPDLDGGTVYGSNGAVQSISLDYIKNKDNRRNNIIWNSLVAADIFFNTDDDDSWNYVVHNPYFDNEMTDIWDVYKIDLPIYSDDWRDYYYESTTPGGRTHRKNHPVSMKPNQSAVHIGEADYSGWMYDLDKNELGTSTWTLSYFGSEHIPFENITAIAIFIECANDIIYEEFASAPVPEPGTFLLMAFGATSMMFYRKRMSKQG
jgi:hypothetical protein